MGAFAAEAPEAPPRGRLALTLSRLAGQRRAGLAMYVTAGDPDPRATAAILRALVTGGVDVIELGYPYEDPALDGPVIREANRRALAAGGSLAATLEAARSFRRSDKITPVVLMGYWRPIETLGMATFAQVAAEAGVDAVLVPDGPPALTQVLAAHDLLRIPFCTPSLDLHQALAHGAGRGGFLYCAPTQGQTGGRAAPLAAVRRQVERCRAATRLPVAVGFGVKTPARAAQVAAIADVVVVATALIARIQALGESADPGSPVFARRLVGYVAGFRAAMDQVRG